MPFGGLLWARWWAGPSDSVVVVLVVSVAEG